MRVTLKRAKKVDLLQLSEVPEGSLCEVIRSTCFPVGSTLCVGRDEVICLNMTRDRIRARRTHTGTAVRLLIEGDTLTVEE